VPTNGARSRLERLLDRAPEPSLILLPVDRADEHFHDPALAVDHERLREAGNAVRRRRVAGPVEDEREAEVEALGERARVATEVLRIETDDDEPAVAMLTPEPLQDGRFLLARDAPRRLEVQHDRPPTERGERELAVLVQPLEREVGRDLAALERVGLVADEAPGEKREEQRDEPDGRALRDEPHSTSAHAYLRTMKTGVPTVTRWNSHSASVIRIRMQPCEAE
jgi:hypothetical protein